MKTLQNQFGLVALAIVVLIAAFMFFGSDIRDEGIVVELEEETAVVENAGKQAPAATTQAKPKPTAAKPAATAPASVPSVTGLNGSTFRLTSYNGAVIPSGQSYSVTFKAGSGTFEDGFVTAKFCNTLTAPYEITNGVISANLSGNRAYCGEPKDIMDLEGAVSRLLGSSRMTLQGNSLTLTDNVTTLVFIRQ